MNWKADKFKTLIAERGFSQESFAKKVGVSRQTVNGWVQGNVPKGIHLIGIWDTLGIDLNEIFERKEADIVPMHRKRGTAKVTDITNQAAIDLAKSYAGLFEVADVPVLQLYVSQCSDDAAKKLAYEMRQLMELQNSDNPPTFAQVLKLLSALNICVIFKSFPDAIKDYAFYTRINKTPVVFVNTSTHINDLVFALLHEAVHAVRCNNALNECMVLEQEDAFCDKVASMAQFSDAYLETIQISLRNKNKPYMQTLVDFSTKNVHSIYGLAKRFKDSGRFTIKTLNQYRIKDNVLKKKYPKFETYLFSEDASVYLKNLEQYSPIWYQIINRHYTTLTPGRLAELLDITPLDARAVIDVFRALNANHGAR